MALFKKPTLQSTSTGEGSGQYRPLLDAGMYNARILKVIDLGIQPGSQTYPEPKPKMEIEFELQDEFMCDKEGKPLEGVPAVFSMELSYSEDGFIGEKSNLYKFYQAINPEMTLSPEEWLALPVAVMLITKKRKSGKHAGEEYSNVSGVAPMKQKDIARATPLVNKPAYFDLSEPVLEVFQELTKGNQYAQQDKIKAAHNYGSSPLPELLGEPVPQSEPEPEQPQGVEQEGQPKPSEGVTEVDPSDDPFA